MKPALRLNVLTGDCAGQQLLIPAPGGTVGRDTQATARIRDPEVPEQWVRLELRPETGWWLEWLGDLALGRLDGKRLPGKAFLLPARGVLQRGPIRVGFEGGMLNSSPGQSVNVTPRRQEVVIKGGCHPREGGDPLIPSTYGVDPRLRGDDEPLLRHPPTRGGESDRAVRDAVPHTVVTPLSVMMSSHRQNLGTDAALDPTVDLVLGGDSIRASISTPSPIPAADSESLFSPEAPFSVSQRYTLQQAQVFLDQVGQGLERLIRSARMGHSSAELCTQAEQISMPLADLRALLEGMGRV